MIRLLRFFYKQTFGTAMSTILAEVVIQHIKRIAINKFPIKLLTNARYVDYVFIKHGRILKNKW